MQALVEKKTELSHLHAKNRSCEKRDCLSKEIRLASDAFENGVEQMIQDFKANKVGAVMMMLSAESFLTQGWKGQFSWMVDEGSVLDFQLKVWFACAMQNLSIDVYCLRLRVRLYSV